ncbi:MAG: biosynthetic arginine decarboxylase [Planctomycetota bacterium]
MSIVEANPIPKAEPGLSWTPSDSADLYRIADWGNGYFGVNDSGHLTATSAGVDLLDIVEGLRARGISAPVLLRFSNILGDRLRAIRAAFDEAITENDYRGEYAAVYPVKVNQQRHVVHDVVSAGAELGFGLEVGSKPELLAVMAMSAPAPDRLIICNGFKDEAYIEAVVLATKLGRKIIPVVESMAELDLIIRFAERYGVRPAIGVRVKLSSAGSGRWQGSVGSKSKFGLYVTELLRAIDTLRAHNMLDCLQLVHCHSGSQTQNIRSIKDVVTELAHIYVEIAKLGAGVKYLDVGGGLGIDYTGMQANAPGSMNYTLEEFASDVVYRIGSVCDNHRIEHPTIITECGRAMVAYSSVLVFDVRGSTGPSVVSPPPREIRHEFPNDALPQPILDLQEALDAVTPKRVLECYHDAVQAREAALTLFSLGYLSLPLRALTERLFWAVCRKLQAVCARIDPDELPEELTTIDELLCDVYFCNFSMFQSLPDAWAIDQLFPIMPIHRLSEQPDHRAVLADITCDSDGQLDLFIGDERPARALPVHALDGQPYYLAAFLVGAYQEILGDLHNLFGDAHAVHVGVEDDGRWHIEEVVRGDTAGEVLGYVQYTPEKLFDVVERDCERAVRRGDMTIDETQTLLNFYDRGLRGYTYLGGIGRE